MSIPALGFTRVAPSSTLKAAMSAEYRYDVFISYRRFKGWPRWVTKFRKPFEHWLGEELGREPQIFYDAHIEDGTDWPLELANGLADARVLVPLLSRQYWSSPWCRAELAHMLAREQSMGMPSGDNPHGIIFPLQLHDGEDSPAQVKRIQTPDISAFANPWMLPEGRKFEQFADRIKKWAKSVAEGIRQAPEFRAEWRNLARDALERVLTLPEPSAVPMPSLAKPPAASVAPPP